jgi:hypothetical protein
VTVTTELADCDATVNVTRRRVGCGQDTVNDPIAGISSSVRPSAPVVACVVPAYDAVAWLSTDLSAFRLVDSPSEQPTASAVMQATIA